MVHQVGHIADNVTTFVSSYPRRFQYFELDVPVVLRLFTRPVDLTLKHFFKLYRSDDFLSRVIERSHLATVVVALIVLFHHDTE